MSIKDEEAAAQALAKATERHKAGDDDAALRFAEKADRLSIGNVTAKELIEFIHNWGCKSEAGEAVKAMIDAPDHYARMGLQRTDAFDDSMLRKTYLRKSRLLHPVSTRA